MMTQQEIKLLEIAKEVIKLNEGANAALTGSLMLRHRGFETRREVSDIDIIVGELDDESIPKMPKGWKQTDQDGEGSEIDAIQFEKDNIRIDFLFSEEPTEMVDGLNCGKVEYLLSAKRSYSQKDQTYESRIKHELDIAFLTKQINDVGRQQWELEEDEDEWDDEEDENYYYQCMCCSRAQSKFNGGSCYTCAGPVNKVTF